MERFTIMMILWKPGSAENVANYNWNKNGTKQLQKTRQWLLEKKHAFRYCL